MRSTMVEVNSSLSRQLQTFLGFFLAPESKDDI